MIGLLDKAEIAALIPHAGPMCLLDAVLAWDMTTIACAASSHRSASNPLAANDRLDAVCGVEYASQAMAVHGGLIGNGRRPSAGYLASLRDVICCVDRLDLLGVEVVDPRRGFLRPAERLAVHGGLIVDPDPVDEDQWFIG